ncbi:hypothetical protein EPUL_003676 [Erysiphe pulchra]|uniref:Uncharacterized protein n=1 Tax=Erysiphe pulchra TaxID=225359 RepID=A0A2S4PSG7_9PEZI|nr:hypothetical protein EPUL_003676 [Erysiphe pulchra]
MLNPYPHFLISSSPRDLQKFFKPIDASPYGRYLLGDNNLLEGESIAPPLVLKRVLPPDPPIVGNRVSKPKATLGKVSRKIIAKAHLLSPTRDARRKDIAIVKVLGEMHGSPGKFLDIENSMEVNTDDELDEGTYFDPFTVTALASSASYE